MKSHASAIRLLGEYWETSFDLYEGQSLGY